MSKLGNVWIIAESDSAIKELSAGAVQLAENVSMLSCSKAGSFTASIPAIVAAVVDKKPDMVLLEASSNGRLAAAAIAVALNTSVLTDVSELRVDGGAVISKRMVYGGAAFKTEKTSAVAVVLCGSGLFDGSGSVTETIEIFAVQSGIRFVEKKAKQGQTANLAAAKKVLGVGRGIGSEANMAVAKEFAAAIGAEIGCTRPVAEEDKWLPKELYIGVSGVMMKPDLYIGAGVSGQIQHMVGINQALTVIAINKDKNAPIFKQCDYGIVGDITKILPALTAKFK